MKKTIILLICIALHPTLSGQFSGYKDTVPREHTFPGITNPAFPYGSPEEVGLSKKKLDRLGDEVAMWVANGELVGGELLIIKDGKTILHEAYGWSDWEENKPLQRNSIWSIKSMSKPFTATAIMMLSEQGKLSVNDKLTHYIPDYMGDPRTTIADLLSHTSGYNGLGNARGYKEIGTWVTFMAKQAPTANYGEYHYADFNYAALGYIVELVSKMPIDEYLQLNILNPLEFQNSFTNFSPDSSWAKNVNSRYKISGNRYEKYWSNKNKQYWNFYPAAWGIWGTAMDYSKFLAIFLNDGSLNGHEFLNEDVAQDMISVHSISGRETDYGYGFVVKPDQENSNMPLWFGHSGYDGTIAFAFPKENLIVILMTHSRGTATLNALRNRLIMLGFIDNAPDDSMVRGHDFSSPIISLSNNEEKAYEGYYKGTDPVNAQSEILIQIELIDDHLRARLNSFGSETGRMMDLIYLGQDCFAPGCYAEEQISWIDPETEFNFIKKEGNVVTLEIRHGRKKTTSHKIDKEEIEQKLNVLRNKKDIDVLIERTIDREGINSARKMSKQLHSSRPDSVNFAENFLNSLGYRYLNQGDYKNAIAVFEMNVEAYMDQPNCYDSLADAYQRQGDLVRAKENYKKAVKLARKQGDSRLKYMKARLDAIVDLLEENDKE